MEQKIILLIIFLLFSKEISAQTSIIKISDKTAHLERNFKEELNLFLSIEFEINHSKLKTTDSNSVSIIPNNIGFDTIKYSYSKKGIRYVDSFICKLRANEVYTISPCTCCGMFLMTPSQNAKRGYVKFINNSRNTFIAMTSEYHYDTIPKKTNTDYFFSSISMNCGFRPNTIFISDLGYLDKKFDYENLKTKSKEAQKILEKEQQSHIVFSFNYLFLHEEKLTVTINKSANNFSLKLSF